MRLANEGLAFGNMENKKVLYHKLTAGLLSAGRHWRRAVNLALEPYEVTEASAAPLLWIAELGGGVRQVTLASYLEIEPASLVRSIDQLEKLELIVRKHDPADRRAKTLWLTPAGHKLILELEQIFDELYGKLFGVVADEDLEAASRVLSSFEGLGN
ncbi:MarR family winged helix-turn-helix transcriptional regulator [Agrobacterium vitis]|uniref:MarR family winged helix-turn-helix transcriptional regulator n=1 Tax=Agrobacterium vitis TaxID=373 RepID=UPI00307D1C8C